MDEAYRMIEALVQKLNAQCDARGIQKAILTVELAEGLTTLKALIQQLEKERNQNGSGEAKSVSS